jgi:hypothetical protein
MPVLLKVDYACTPALAQTAKSAMVSNDARGGRSVAFHGVYAVRNEAKCRVGKSIEKSTGETKEGLEPAIKRSAAQTAQCGFLSCSQRCSSSNQAGSRKA